MKESMGGTVPTIRNQYLPRQLERLAHNSYSGT